MPSRRSFLGTIFAGAGAAAAVAVGAKAETLETIERKIIVPDSATAQAIMDAPDGQVIAASIDDARQLGLVNYAKGHSAGTPGWFGMPDTIIEKMGVRKASDWLHDHLSVNRKYGFNSAAWLKDLRSMP